MWSSGEWKGFIGDDQLVSIWMHEPDAIRPVDVITTIVGSETIQGDEYPTVLNVRTNHPVTLHTMNRFENLTVCSQDILKQIHIPSFTDGEYYRFVTFEPVGTLYPQVAYVFERVNDPSHIVHLYPQYTEYDVRPNSIQFFTSFFDELTLKAVREIVEGYHHFRVRDQTYIVPKSWTNL